MILPLCHCIVLRLNNLTPTHEIAFCRIPVPIHRHYLCFMNMPIDKLSSFLLFDRVSTLTFFHFEFW